MTQNVVYKNGTKVVAVASSSKIAVRSVGAGSAKVYQEINSANYPENYSLIGTVSNEEKVFSITTACNVKIEAGADDVQYEVGTNPSAVEFVPPSGNQAHVYFNDFDTYVVGDWTLTTVEAGAGSATEALGNEDGGVLVITNDAADDDSDFFQKIGESFKFEVGKKLWFDCRFKVSDATQSDVVIGLQITDTTPLDVSDGVFFLKVDGSTTMNLLVEKNNTATTTAVATLANNTYVRLGFYYDGDSLIYAYENGVQVATSAVTNMVDDEELTISFGIQNGEAVAKVMTVDYIYCAKQR